MRQAAKKIKRAFLVYQGGLANVFQVDCHNLANYGRHAQRLMQSDFRSCEWYSVGLRDGGVIVRTASCNKAGDVINEQWTEDLASAPFNDQFQPVN